MAYDKEARNEKAAASVRIAKELGRVEVFATLLSDGCKGHPDLQLHCTRIREIVNNLTNEVAKIK